MLKPLNGYAWLNEKNNECRAPTPDLPISNYYRQVVS
jgi:hypothetical protein